MIASLSNNILVTCSRNVMIRTDALFTEVKQEIYDAVILPGGLKGAEAFAAVRSFSIIPHFLSCYKTRSHVKLLFY